MTKPSDLLDQAMDERRIELRMSWKDVAEKAGVSVETLTALRKGRTNARNANPLTKRGIEDALKWEVGGFDDALADRRPASVEVPHHEHAPPGEIDPWSLTEAQFRALSAEQQMKVLARMLEVAQEQWRQPRQGGESQRPAG